MKCAETNSVLPITEDDNTSTLMRELMTVEEKKRDLYLRQKQLLDTFLEHGAISRAQYDKSLGDLTLKMGIDQMDSQKIDQK